jgi:predicted nucleotidyltransferase
MPDPSQKLDLVELIRLLERHGVEYMFIGGVAAQFMGSAQLTYDIDVCYWRTQDNLERLAAALREIHPTLRGAPPDLPFQLDAASLALGNNFTFNTDFGPVDFLGWLDPIGAYENLLPDSEEFQTGDHRIKTIGLHDLIRIKEHLHRPKDQLALLQLYEIRKLRAQNEK